jgi:hypothetical protein
MDPSCSVASVKVTEGKQTTVRERRTHDGQPLQRIYERGSMNVAVSRKCQRSAGNDMFELALHPHSPGATRLSSPRNDSQRTDARGSAQTTSRLPATGPKADMALRASLLCKHRLRGCPWI